MSEDMNTAVEEYAAGGEQRAIERLRVQCLQRCDEMTCGTYEWPEWVPRTDWLILIVITIALLVLTWLGSLF